MFLSRNSCFCCLFLLHVLKIHISCFFPGTLVFAVYFCFMFSKYTFHVSFQALLFLLSISASCSQNTHFMFLSRHSCFCCLFLLHVLKTHISCFFPGTLVFAVYFCFTFSKHTFHVSFQALLFLLSISASRSQNTHFMFLSRHSCFCCLFLLHVLKTHISCFFPGTL